MNRYFNLVSLILLLCNSISIAQEYKTILSINTGGHKSLIKDMAITSDKKYLISTGDDKVIKIWNLETGELDQEIFGQCQEGENGKILGMALSPDDKYLAVGGSLYDDKYNSIVRLYDLKTRKLIKILKPNKDSYNFYYAMSFTADSRYLLTGTGLKEITAWKIPTGEVALTWETPTYRDLTIQLHDSLLLTASVDSSVMLWNIYQGKPVKVNKTAHKHLVYYANFSPDGKYIVSVGYDEKINVYDRELNLLNSYSTPVRPATVEFSPNGKKILMGFVERGAQYCQLYDFNEGKLTHFLDFKEHNEIVLATRFLNDSTAITAGGDDNEILFWTWKKNPKTKTYETKILKSLVGKGHSIWGVAMTGKTIAFTTNKTGEHGSSVLEKTFDLLTHEQKSIKNSGSTFKGPIHEYGEYSLKTAKGGSVDFEDADLIILKNGVECGRIKRDIYNIEDGGIRHHSYTLIKDKFVVTGGDNGVLMAYDLKGKLVSTFFGHTGRIWSVAPSDDGKYLVTGTSDQTIKLWRTDEIGQRTALPPMSVLDVYTDTSWANYFKQLRIDKIASIKTNDGWKQVIRALKDNKDDVNAKTLENYLNWKDIDFIKPIASIFISSDNEWVVWCDDGYFTSSKKGGQYIGYHVNNGYDKEAKFYPFEQFDLKFNRPDILMERLATADSATRKAYHLAYQKRLKKMHFTETDLSEDIHVPVVAINNKQKEGDNYNLTVTLSDSKYELDRVYVTVNDVPVYGSQGMGLQSYKTQEIIRFFSIPLQDGKNTIRISALNVKGGESLMETVAVNHQASKTTKNLYVVSIGVSDYDNKEMNLKYAKKDASDISKLFTGNNKLYTGVKADTIFNLQATAQNIESVKAKLFQTSVDDKVIIFMAGHGLLDANLDYFLATHDVDFNNPSKNGLLYERLEGLLDSIPARFKVLFMDACHSGELDKDEVVLASNTKKEETGDIVFRSGTTSVQNKGLSRENSFELMKELFTDLRKGVGATVISSAGGAEYAMESAKWNNGVFTFCLLKGLKEKKADLNNDGKIMISELQQYLQKTVPELTGGKQRPTSRVENINNDWQVW